MSWKVDSFNVTLQDCIGEEGIIDITAVMDTWTEIISWCAENFGPEGTRWQLQSQTAAFCIQLESEEDLSWFLLKWS
jgi:hypothetical protein